MDEIRNYEVRKLVKEAEYIYEEYLQEANNPKLKKLRITVIDDLYDVIQRIKKCNHI